MSDLGAFWIGCGICLGLTFFGYCFENGLRMIATAIEKPIEYENEENIP